MVVVSRYFLSFSVLVIYFLGGSPMLYAGEASLTWSANKEPDLWGYYLYYKDPKNVLPLTKSNYTHKINIGNTTFFEKSGLDSGTHAFALSAYDTALNESPLSLVVTKDGSAPSSDASAGGCGRVTTKGGPPPGPEAAAGLPTLVGLIILFSLKRMLRRRRA